MSQPNPIKGGGHWFWCGTQQRHCLHKLDGFLCTQYLTKQLADFKQFCLDIVLGHDKELLLLLLLYQIYIAPLSYVHTFKSALHKIH